MKLNYVDVDRYRIPVFLQDKKKDTTYFFLHGLNSSSDFMQSLLKHKHDYNVVAINFPGSKYTEIAKHKEVTLDWWIKVAQAIIKKIKTKHIVIVAHSMGGGVALELASNPKVKRLIMISTINPYMAQSRGYYFLEKVIAPKGKISKFFGNIISSITSKLKKMQNLNEVFAKGGAWHNLLENYVLNPDYLKKIDKQYHKFANKIIMLIGDKDPIIGTNEFCDYAEEIEVPCFVMAKGHSPIKDQPKKLARFLNSWEQSKKRSILHKFTSIKTNKINFKPNLWKGISDDALDIDEEILNSKWGD